VLPAILDEGKKTSSSQKVPQAFADFRNGIRISTVPTFEEGRTSGTTMGKDAARNGPRLESREPDYSNTHLMKERLDRRDFKLIDEWSEESGESALQDFPQQFVFLLAEFFAAFREVEDVDGFLAFGVDQGYVYVAAEAGEGGTDVVQQAWAVLHHDLKECALRRRRIVVADAGFDGNLRGLCFAGTLTASEQRFELRFSVHDVREALLEARDFAGV
jgi:hypothetical protein